VLAAATVATAERPSAYNAYGWKWSTTQVPYYINPVNADVSQSAAIAAIQAGAAAWSEQANTAFGFYLAGFTTSTTTANNGRNEVFFRSGTNGTYIATTYYWYSGSRALDADIVFWDGAYKFYTGASGCTGGFYIEDVATHEFGHALGLGHSSVSDATMVSGQKYCGTYKRSLAADDKQAVETLYPVASTTYAPTINLMTPSQGTTFAAETAITFSGSALDAEDGVLTSRISWSSSLDGWLGSGGSVVATPTAGSHTITATVTDSHGMSATASVAITVAAPAAVAAPSSSIVLTGSGSKVKGYHRVNLRWSGATTAQVAVYRGTVRVATVANTGSYTDALNTKGSGSYVYRVCLPDLSACSNTVTIAF
jgi:hypothetical protein